MAKIFYVEDDKNLSIIVSDTLQIENHEVWHYEKGDEALAQFKPGIFDLCLLDVMLPNMDGFSLAKTIRSLDPSIPIIFISAKTQIEDKLEGLELGGDDYIFKPFSIEELLLKVKIFFKRRSAELTNNIQTPKIIKLGAFDLDYENLKLEGPNFSKILTQREADLVRFFALNPNRLLKREEMLVALWGHDDYFLGRSMDVFISRVRKYLATDPNIQIQNIPRVGFQLILR